MRRPLVVFLADDDADDVELFEETIHYVDPTAVFQSASNGYEALQFLERHAVPDIIFFDLNMPMIDGRKCLQTIKHNEKFKGVPVIMFTTSSFPNDVTECLSLGAVCFVTKPTDIVELRKILRTIIDNAHGNDLCGALKTLRTEAGIYC